MKTHSQVLHFFLLISFVIVVGWSSRGGEDPKRLQFQQSSSCWWSWQWLQQQTLQAQCYNEDQEEWQCDWWVGSSRQSSAAKSSPGRQSTCLAHQIQVQDATFNHIKALFVVLIPFCCPAILTHLASYKTWRQVIKWWRLWTWGWNQFN